MSEPAAPSWVDMPTSEGGSVRRPVTFANLVEKARWLDASASLDARHPGVRELAIRFSNARASSDRRGLAHDLHAFVRDSVKYVYGPSFQEFADSWTILNRPGGAADNCAGKSRLFVALCRAVELEARILPNFRTTGEFNHVQAQVRYPGSDKDPRAEDGGWLRAELIIQGVPLGGGPESGTRGPAGGMQLT